MFERLFSLDWRRRRLLRKTPAGPLRDYLATPFPAANSDCNRVEFVALDLETTGLQPKHDEIVSIGLVRLSGSRIDLGTALHRLVQPTRSIPEHSAVIHQITDDAAATGGAPLSEVLAEVLPLLAGRVLIAHHARVELGFLGTACQRLYGGTFLIPTVDTQWLERRTLERRNQAFAPKALRLAELRRRYQLPRYRAHDALSDAVATAELFTAQLALRAGERGVLLKEVLLPQ